MTRAGMAFGPFAGSCANMLAEQFAIAAAERGLVIARVSRDHVRRSLGRVAAKRALLICHILNIEGRGYPQWLPRHTA